jgi:hypothetical protein
MADSPTESVSTELEFEIDRVVPLAQYKGDALVVSPDPRFVVVGRVRWIQKQAILAVHSQQAFAIHSPTRMGLNGWAKGSTICWILQRTRSAGRTSWLLIATKPDAACNR